MTLQGRVRSGLLAVALGGAALRFWGLGYGLPHPTARPDEEFMAGKALQISLGRMLDPGAFPYPDLLYYVDALVLSAWRNAGHLVGAYGSTDDFLRDVAVYRPALHYRICRSVGALFGMATLLVTFGAAFHAYRRWSVSLLAALLVAVNFLHARDSHFATVDVPMTFFVTLAIAFSLRSGATKSRRDVLLSAFCAGLATSAKYNAGLVILCPVVAAGRDLFRPVAQVERWRILATLAMAVGAMAAAFALTSPYCVLHLTDVLGGLGDTQRVLFAGSGLPAWKVHLRTTLPGAFGWPGFVAVLVGVVRATWKRRPSDLVLLAFIIPTFASMGEMTWVLPRYLMSMVPALAILAAEATLSFLLLARAGWVAVAVLALTLPPLWNIISYDRLAARQDTRVQAADWVAENLPPRSRVALCRGYGAPAVNDDHRRPPAFKPEIVPCSIGAIRETGARYVVIHDHPYVRFFLPAQDVVPWLKANGRLLVTFDPFRAGTGITPYFFGGDAFYLPYSGFAAVERGGPIVTIWDLAGH